MQGRSSQLRLFIYQELSFGEYQNYKFTDFMISMLNH